MVIRKTLTSIVLAGALALSIAGCKDNENNQPKQNIFPYTQTGQIAEVPVDFYNGSIGLAAADFDGDGDIDLATVRTSSEGGKVFLYRNDGQDNYSLVGQIAEVPVDFYNGSIGLAAADFDGDGDIDLATVRNSSEGGKVFLYRNDGADKFIKTSE